MQLARQQYNQSVSHTIQQTPITTGDIKAYLKKCKSSSAPGLDGIRYGVLKQANDKVYEALAQICNACMATGYYPKLWKKA